MTTTEIAGAPRLATDYLRVSDLDWRQLDELLDLAAEMKAKPYDRLGSFRGRSVACYFEKPSTRTRVSFEGAAYRLGMLPIMLRPDELQLGRGETVGDTAKVLSGYCAAIVARVFSQEVLEELAAAAEVPVINALSDTHHPCQALADLLTLKEHFGRLEGLKLAYLGDANNVANSLIEATALAGMELRLATPDEYAADPVVLGHALEVGQTTGAEFFVTTDPAEAAEGADALYTDVWVSMGQDAETERRLDVLAPYQVNDALLERASDDAVFLHCLPAHRGQEVAASVIDGPASLVFQQAANRLPTEQAVLSTLLERARAHELR
jgi:ornithine carbamoyltransferase